MATCMMHKLYWKIFLSFWVVSFVIIVSTIWLTGVVTRNTTISEREKNYVNSYAHAAISIYESGKENALLDWLARITQKNKLDFYLLTSDNQILSNKPVSPLVKSLQSDFLKGQMPEGIIKRDHYLISHEFLTLADRFYRLVVITHVPITETLKIPWWEILKVFLLTLLLSGLMCYLLSHYLTKPLATLRNLAKNIAYGHLETRVEGDLITRSDELGDLSKEFNYMANRLEHLVKTKERLLQDISHELRSPLARLQLAIELCRTKTTSECHEDFERMELEISRLNALIGELLSLAKLQDPNKKLQLTNVDLNYLVESLAKDAGYEFRDKQINVLFNKDEICIAAIDEKLIHRALENIIRNAFRYSNAQDDIEIQLYRQGTNILIEVNDRGPGVPDVDLEAIFSPFYRVDSSRGASTGGYGIGLAIAKKAIELHHGKISAQKNMPTGLKIQITLPANLPSLLKDSELSHQKATTRKY